MKRFFSFLSLFAILSASAFANSAISKLPFSPAVEAGGFIFVSGQLPKDPQTGKLMEGTVEELTHQIMTQIEDILAEHSATLDDAVRMEVYLKDLNDFAEMNRAYAEHFEGRFPARQAMQVGKLPFDSKIEISCIAYKSPLR